MRLYMCVYTHTREYIITYTITYNNIIYTYVTATPSRTYIKENHKSRARGRPQSRRQKFTVHKNVKIRKCVKLYIYVRM